MFLQEHIVMTETSTHFCHDIQVYENTKAMATEAGGHAGCQHFHPAPFGRLRAGSSLKTRRNGATALSMPAGSKAWATSSRVDLVRAREVGAAGTHPVHRSQ
jgi:hypothetical protein